MILRKGYKRRSARIEMVPLIDIVFLLLVFFIYAMLSMAVHRGMQVDIPESENASVSTDSPLSVSLRKEQGIVRLYLNRQPLGLDELAERLEHQAGSLAAGREVLLFADRQVSYQELYRVLDSLTEAGITSISLQAEQER